MACHVPNYVDFLVQFLSFDVPLLLLGKMFLPITTWASVLIDLGAYTSSLSNSLGMLKAHSGYLNTKEEVFVDFSNFIVYLGINSEVATMVFDMLYSCLRGSFHVACRTN